MKRPTLFAIVLLGLAACAGEDASEPAEPGIVPRDPEQVRHDIVAGVEMIKVMVREPGRDLVSIHATKEETEAILKAIAAASMQWEGAEESWQPSARYMLVFRTNSGRNADFKGESLSGPWYMWEGQQKDYIYMHSFLHAGIINQMMEGVPADDRR